MADGEPPKHPRISKWKATSVLAVLVLLTPVWVVYGYLGVLLALPSSTISKTGLNLLTAIGLWFTFQTFSIQVDKADVDGWWTTSVVGSWIVLLLIVQWQVHRLLVFHMNRKAGDTRVDAIGLLLFSFFVAVAAMLTKPSLAALAQSPSLFSYYSFYIFWTVYVALPVIVAISHAKIWIPARYSELERLEREIIERNVQVPFEIQKVAGLGTVYVPCTAPTKAEEKFPLVLVHGYAAGNALWACNFEELAKHYDVYAVEWLGTGRSDRPIFTSYEMEYVDALFVDALEKWRKELKIDKFYVGGHSMGAMIAGAYAVKYPGNVQHLVLISPAGVGHPPPPGVLPFGLRIFRSLWSLRWTPMSVARYAGPLGPAFLRFIASARVGMMPEMSCIRRGLIPVEALAAYWYNNWCLEKSGEIAMHSHLLPGVYAKKPLCVILTPESINVPITFMYGGGPDWMTASHGEKLAETFAGKQSVEVVMVPGAGHQVFMDNVPAFNELLLSALSRS